MAFNKTFLAIFLSIFTYICIIPTVAFAGSFNITVDEWPYALMGLLGGITFLIYGLDKMTSAIKSLADKKLKVILGTLTKNRLASLTTGAVVTMIVQSSAATTVMVVGFISAKLMTLPQSLGVILGADIGTTVTVQLIAFKLNQYSLIAITAGFLIKKLSKNEHIWQVGRLVMGIGTLFFGVFIISESMSILSDLSGVNIILKYSNHPAIALLIGAVMTALMQSSAAMLAIIIALTTQQLISLEAGLMFMLGANIGTSFTAFVASAGARLDARRAATAHMFFKVSGVLLILPFMGYFQDFINTNGEIASPREIANAHTLFNVIIAIIFLPFINIIANKLVILIPERRKERRYEPQFIDEKLLDTPSLALNAARNETVYMGKLVETSLKDILLTTVSGGNEDFHKIHSLEQDIENIYKKLIHYLGEISRQNLTEHQGQELMWLMSSVNNLETISDTINDDLSKVASKRHKMQITVSKSTYNKLEEIHEDAVKMLKYGVKLLNQIDDKNIPEKVKIDKEEFKNKISTIISHQSKRLISKDKNRVATYSLEIDIIESMQNIYYSSRKIATEAIKSKVDNNS